MDEGSFGWIEDEPGYPGNYRRNSSHGPLSRFWWNETDPDSGGSALSGGVLQFDAEHGHASNDAFLSLGTYVQPAQVRGVSLDQVSHSSRPDRSAVNTS